MWPKTLKMHLDQLGALSRGQEPWMEEGPDRTKKVWPHHELWEPEQTPNISGPAQGPWVCLPGTLNCWPLG